MPQNELITAVYADEDGNIFSAQSDGSARTAESPRPGSTGLHGPRRGGEWVEGIKPKPDLRRKSGLRAC